MLIQKLISCDIYQCTAIIDSGTSMIAAPTEAFQLMTNASRIRSDCSNYDFLENLKFEINGVKFNLDKEFYVLKIADTNGVKCMNALMELNSLSSSMKYTFLLGVPFFKKYYTVFDRETNRIGFGVANHDSR